MGWSLSEHLRDLQYHIDYAKINYRQRYYSTSRNPRVIQARIGNEPLLSLRTYPLDLYIVKPGEFLALERKCKRSKGKILQPSAEDPFLNFSRLNSLEESRELPVEASGSGDVTQSESPKLGLKDRFRSFKGRYQSLHLLKNNPLKLDAAAPSHDLPSPILETVNGDMAMWNQQIDNGGPQPPQLPPRRPVRCASDTMKQSLCVRPDTSRANWVRRKSSGSRRSNESAVWKSVLNDISLSAARVTAGHQPKCNSAYRVLSCDFINVEAYLENCGVGAEWQASRPRTAPTLDGGDYYDVLSLYDLTMRGA